MTAFKVSNLKETDYLIVRQGFQTLSTGEITDAIDIPIDISDWTVSIKVEFYNAKFTPPSDTDRASGSITNFILLADTPVRDLTITLDSDQVNNPGRFTVLIPEDLYTGNIPLDTDDVVVGVAYLKLEFSMEKRTPLFFIVYRRGQPS